MDDWQEAAFNNRRIPHGRGGRGGGRKGGSFDARKTYGVYELQGSAIDKVLAGDKDTARAVLEIHGLTDSGDGLLGSIQIGNALAGMVLLAASRRTLERNVKELADETGDDVDAQAGGAADEEDEDESGSDEGEADDAAQPFEKNTFRSPKFWVQWRALVSGSGEKNAPTKGETDRGYFVFAGNDCKTFQGTIKCQTLGWKNAALTGRKLTPKSTDCPTEWTDISLTKN